ncbi:MAG: MOSC domain-containing protein [Acidimicrobiales bacterium]
MLATVLALHRYPVKSMQGEAVERLDLTERGAEGDRRWGVVDAETGKVLSAKRVGALLEATARLDGPSGRSCVVTLPDGSAHEAGDPASDVALSAWLGRDVRLQPADEAAPAGYEMNTDATDESSPIVEFPCPPGTFLDAAAIHLLTTASLDVARTVHPAGDWNPHRFRPTALAGAAGDHAGFVEDGWIGATLGLGTADLYIFAPTVRCAMPTRPQPAHGLDRDPDVARTLTREHGSNLGVYAAVRVAGMVAVGDELRRLD